MRESALLAPLADDRGASICRSTRVRKKEKEKILADGLSSLLL